MPQYRRVPSSYVFGKSYLGVELNRAVNQLVLIPFKRPVLDFSRSFIYLKISSRKFTEVFQGGIVVGLCCLYDTKKTT